mgnify:CR=1 FL=1|jgi:hypothetical protein
MCNLNSATEFKLEVERLVASDKAATEFNRLLTMFKRGDADEVEVRAAKAEMDRLAA